MASAFSALLSTGEVVRSPDTDCEFEWRIPDFVLLMKSDKMYFSPTFSFNAAIWRMCIDVEFIHLNAGVIRESTEPLMNLGVLIGFKTSKGKKDRVKYADNGARDGYEMYISFNCLQKTELLKRMSDLLSSNSLTVTCTMKLQKAEEGVQKCGLVFSTNTIAYRCRTCAIRSSMCLCSDCFKRGNHQGHDFSACFASNDGWFCDCGDKSFLNESGFCERHGPRNRMNNSGAFPHVLFVTEVLMPRLFSRLEQHLQGDVAISKCSYCNDIVDAKDISSHQKKCVDKPIKCPECSEVVALKNWYEHTCQTAKSEAESCESASSNVLLENKVLNDFKEFFLKHEDCDVTIKVQGQELQAHKAILQARSPVFASTFRNEMKEKATGVVNIDDCDPSSFSDFLCFLYCGEKAIISEANVCSLFTTADKYDVQDLRAQCVKFMKENLSVGTFCDTITLALRHSEKELINLTTDFFTKNAPKIILTVKWLSFLAENTTEGNELLVKLLVPSNSK